jgi:hypothetical protein
MAPATTSNKKAQYELKMIAGKEAYLLGLNGTYLAAFMRDMDGRQYEKHARDRENPLRVVTTGWSYGQRPRYFDGRIVGVSSVWVYARREIGMPEGAMAAVWLMTGVQKDLMVGYIYKK